MTTFVRCAGGEEALLDTLNFHLYRLPDLSVASRRRAQYPLSQTT